MILQALSLGLSAGLFCMFRCVPTLAPLLLLSPQKGIRAGINLVGVFLAGRLVAYCILGASAGFLGSYGSTIPYTNSLLAVTQILLGALLVTQAFASCTRQRCPGKSMLFGTKKTIFIAGGLSSVSLCPPILLAISMAFEQANPVKGFFFFLIFFIATCLYIIPASLAAIKLNHKFVHIFSQILCAGTGIYFIWKGGSIFFIDKFITY